MALWKQYVRPGSVEEALALLHAAQGPTAIIAGGTDLLLDMQQGRHPPVDLMVDVSGIREMRQVRQEGERIELGAALTHHEIIESPLFRERGRALVEACSLIGGPQVRNVATIGGNVAHALPAGDGTIALLSLGAEAQIASRDGRRWEPLEALFAGPGQTTFDREREILVSFRFPASGPREGSAFRRVMRPQGVAIAILNMGAWVRCGPAGEIADVRIAVGPAGPKPLRARGAEEALRGRALDEAALEAARLALLAEARVRTSRHRATAEYRQHLIGVLLRRTLYTAHARAAGEKVTA